MLDIVGVDEVGRGCLAGDVFVAAVMVPEDMPKVEGVNDSKKLSPARREALYEALKGTPDVHAAIGVRSVQFINDKGITVALRQSFLEAIGKLVDLHLPVGAIRTDGKPLWPVDYFDTPTEFIIGGDASDWAIGAASIVAKVSRDAYMVEQAAKYRGTNEKDKGYGWERNKGYGSKEHIEAIQRLGLTPLHRTKFCRNFVPLEPVEDEGTDLIMELFGEG